MRGMGWETERTTTMRQADTESEEEQQQLRQPSFSHYVTCTYLHPASHRMNRKQSGPVAGYVLEMLWREWETSADLEAEFQVRYMTVECMRVPVEQCWERRSSGAV